jgi:hypothetical protein
MGDWSLVSAHPRAPILTRRSPPSDTAFPRGTAPFGNARGTAEGIGGLAAGARWRRPHPRCRANALSCSSGAMPRPEGPTPYGRADTSVPSGWLPASVG